MSCSLSTKNGLQKLGLATICLVPVQIIWAENNELNTLLHGLQLPPYFTYVDSITLAFFCGLAYML